MQRIEAEITRAKREGEAFSLLALDFDNFKAVNDHYGHQVGDEVLQDFVRRCFDAIRPYDGVARAVVRNLWFCCRDRRENWLLPSVNA
ncbi:hypothetical protein AWV80_20890 [Cupriavidus sp. UYMU48A]|nr:hypothetical protein AWV80_20890 [Cupriavidus sp. UYMU48A]